MPPQVVSLAEGFAEFTERWQPYVAADVNDVQVKVVKMQGEFVWHHHEDEDELFWVIRGRLRMRFRDGDVVLEPNELLVVPRGVEHCPVADEEADVVMIEPKTTLNVGNAVDNGRYPAVTPRRLGSLR